MSTFRIILDEMSNTFIKKTHDYASPDDEYKNFRMSEHAGIAVEDAILVRAMDKVSRLLNLWHREDEAKVPESIDDTLMDLANYCVILLAYRRDLKSEGK